MDTAKSYMSEEEIKKIPIETIRFQTDPFYNECRAYGRLIECNVNGKVAVRCHGHMAIPATREEELDRRFEVYKWDRPENDSKLSVSKRQPFRAIVKDLIEDDSLNERKLIRMRKDLLKMHKMGVYPQDVVCTSPAHYTFVQAIREPRDIVSRLPCSPLEAQC